MIVDQWWNDD